MNRYRRSLYHCLPTHSWRLITFYCLFFLVDNFFLYAQAPTRQQLTGTWIGVHSEWDQDFTCPLPVYMQLAPDSTYRLGMVDGSATALTSSWSAASDQIRLDTIHFAPKVITLQNDLLRIGKTYPMLFRRFTDVAIDSTATANQLTGYIWQSDVGTFYFYADGRIALEDPIAKEKTVHHWRPGQIQLIAVYYYPGKPVFPQWKL